MNRLFTTIASIALAGTSAAALAKQPVDREVDVDEGAPAPAGYEEVDGITLLTRPYSFRAIDDDSLIIWRTRNDPYLVELRYPSRDLKWAWGIGFSSWGSRLTRFDDVHVQGLRYPIDKIYKLDRETAEELGNTS